MSGRGRARGCFSSAMACVRSPLRTPRGLRRTAPVGSRAAGRAHSDIGLGRVQVARQQLVFGRCVVVERDVRWQIAGAVSSAAAFRRPSPRQQCCPG